MMTGFGIRDSGFGAAASRGVLLPVAATSRSYSTFHTESEFVDRGAGFSRIPNAESRIPEFNP